MFFLHKEVEITKLQKVQVDEKCGLGDHRGRVYAKTKRNDRKTVAKHVSGFGIAGHDDTAAGRRAGVCGRE